jgi:hypothetical protein
MITNSIKIVFEWSDLRSGIILVLKACRRSIWDIASEIQSFDGENNRRLRLVPKEPVLCRESFKLNKEYRRQSSYCEGFAGSPGDFTTGTVPAQDSVSVICRILSHDYTYHASSPSMTSAFTKSSINSWTTTPFLPAGTGSDIYINVSKVVDVYTYQQRFDIKPISLPCDKSNTPVYSYIDPGTSRQ